MVLKSIGTLPIYILSYILPKEKDLWVFGAWFGGKYSDNTKYFYEFCESKKNKNYWIVKDKSLLLSLSEKNINVLYYLSLKGLWVQLRAEKVFITQSVMSDLFSPAINRTVIFQLWHGLALKKIMFDVKKSYKMRIFESVMSCIFPYSMHRQDYVVATSNETSRIFASAFNLPLSKVLITGLPRNDKLINSKVKEKQQTAKFNFIYMPTFRGGIGSEIDLFYRFKFDADRLSRLLDENNATLTLRLHPVNKPSNELLSSISEKQNIYFSDTDDIYEEINRYDCLITDFSSIYLDFILTDKPIIFSPFELDSYISNDRELYYNYEEATLPCYCYNWTGIERKIVEVVQGNLSRDYYNKYKMLQEVFHNINKTGRTGFCDNLFSQIIALDKKL